MAGEHGKNMSLLQFNDVVRLVMAEHAWGQGHWIKYIRPSFDCRTGDIYGISFSGAKGKLDFFVVNEDRHRDLTAWVMDFLDSDPASVTWGDFRDAPTTGV